jgi:hypothetical protein
MIAKDFLKPSASSLQPPLEGPPDWRREPVGSRSSMNCALRVQLPLLPLWPDPVLVSGDRL